MDLVIVEITDACHSEVFTCEVLIIRNYPKLMNYSIFIRSELVSPAPSYRTTLKSCGVSWTGMLTHYGIKVINSIVRSHFS